MHLKFQKVKSTKLQFYKAIFFFTIFYKLAVTYTDEAVMCLGIMSDNLGNQVGFTEWA